MPDVLIARPRLDCSFKPGAVPNVMGPPRNEVLRRFGVFLDALEAHHRKQGDAVTVETRPLWHYELAALQSQARCHDRVYFPHRLAAQFPIGPNAFYYKNAPLPGYYTIDPAGWGASLSFLPPVPITGGRRVPVDRLRAPAMRNESIFDQPPYGPPAIEGPHLLFLCQLPHDETIRFHSDVGVDHALDVVIRYAEARGRRLVVKGHPANPRSMEPLRRRVAGSETAVWTDQVSIHSCLRHAERVFLVNSGAGMEALLHDRTVIRFGRAEYDSVVPQASPDVGALIALESHRHDSSAYVAFLEAFASHCVDPADPGSFAALLDRLVPIRA